MIPTRLGLALVLAVPLVGLRSASALGPPAMLATSSPIDPHSHSNPDQYRVSHISLVLNVDFERKILEGTATLSVRREPTANPKSPLILDARGLRITRIGTARKVGDSPLPYTEGPEDPLLGRAVAIDLQLKPGEPAESLVTIHYETKPDAGALQWLDPPQTAGGQRPFLFTQSEAIQARTWIPCQDSPGVRTTYDAWITTPDGLKAVMSAYEWRRERDQPANRFHFQIDQPIPAYLIALAVGDLEFRALGPRTGVWAEPSVVAKAAYEFADTEKMIEATETRFGPYRWTRYDLLVLPPSFPFGGMENPMLTFATPTILAGDRSLVALVAHELAHSWSGNLVTNATWNDFWLNEGFTVYLERRIVEAVYGVDRRQMEDVLGIGELRADLARLDARDQHLKLDLAGRDPDDGMNQVAYEKGALFLIELERVFGRDRFDSWLRGYFDRHAFQSITTEDFVADLRANLLVPTPDLAKQVDLDAWIHQPGLAAKFIEPTSSRLDAVDRLARDYAGGRIAAHNLPAAHWTTQETLQFLRALPSPLAGDRMADLDAALHLTDRPNAEIAGQWLLMATQNDYRPADDRVRTFLLGVGRRKFIVPIYRALKATPAGLDRARTIFAQARAGYHPIAAESVGKLLAP